MNKTKERLLFPYLTLLPHRLQEMQEQKCLEKVVFHLCFSCELCFLTEVVGSFPVNTFINKS